jgi:hypothetical protein
MSDDVQIEWVRDGDIRVCREVYRLFEKAAEKLNAMAVTCADQRRRAIARLYDPEFPAEWGQPIDKHWLVVDADGNELLSTCPPEDGKSLTVWQFGEFEITATFNRAVLVVDDDAVSSWGMEFRRSPPPEGRWQYAGPADNYSSIWRRLKGGAQ